MQYPKIEIKSEDIYTFDEFYKKLIDFREVREHGFVKVVLTDREVPNVTVGEAIAGVPFHVQLNKISAPENSARGIYRAFGSPCPKRTLDVLEQMLIDERQLSPDARSFFSSTSSNEIKESAPKRRMPARKGRAKKIITAATSVYRSHQYEPNRSESIVAEPEVQEHTARWCDLPLFNGSIDRTRLTPREYIKTYWANHHVNRPQRFVCVYDISLFNNKIKKMNIAALFNPLEMTRFMNIDSRPSISSGVNSTMIITSCPDTSFTWHDEDLDLGSINYMHWGATKHWVIAHASSSDKLRDALIRDFRPSEPTECANPIKHKNYLTDLEWLDDNDIQYSIVSSI